MTLEESLKAFHTFTDAQTRTILVSLSCLLTGLPGRCSHPLGSLAS